MHPVIHVRSLHMLLEALRWLGEALINQNERRRVQELRRWLHIAGGNRCNQQFDGSAPGLPPAAA